MPLIILTGVPLWQLVLFACNLIAFAALLARIVSMRLTRAYPALAVWLSANVVLSLIPWIVRLDMLGYYWGYICAEGSTLVFRDARMGALTSPPRRDRTGLIRHPIEGLRTTE